MTQEELEKSLDEMLKEFNTHVDKCLNEILAKIDLLLQDLEQRKKERKKYGPLLGF